MTDVALARAREILAIQLDPEDKHYMRKFTLLANTIADVLRTQQRADQESLRGQKGNKLDDILDRLKAEDERRSGAVIVQH